MWRRGVVGYHSYKGHFVLDAPPFIFFAPSIAKDVLSLTKALILLISILAKLNLRYNVVIYDKHKKHSNLYNNSSNTERYRWCLADPYFS